MESLAPPSTSTQNPNPNLAEADLPTTISILSSVAALAETTLSTLSTSIPSSDHPTFSQCPHDPHHRMPPESLFRHSLTCRSSPASALLDPDFPDRFRYPTSLKSEEEVENENGFVCSAFSPDEDQCFSIDGEVSDFGIGSGFFYKDCPGVVSFPEVDESSRMFTLPGLLAAECANFDGGLDVGDGKEEEDDWILPSEVWELRREVGSWKDFPKSYSYLVLRVVSTGVCGMMLKWIIARSARYGILIDSPMGAHICFLVKLCLKAIRRESCRCVENIREKEGSLRQMRSGGGAVDCPCLEKSMAWLASKLSILYGEINGKFFAIDMLKESILQSGVHSLLFPVDVDTCRERTPFSSDSTAGVKIGAPQLELEPTENCSNLKSLGSMSKGKVFVSQIASAIAALHERSLIESRIKELNFVQALPTYQRLNDHCYRSTTANDVRAKRPNYKPLLDHDGVLWQQASQQERFRPKSREELLAEERDYKRRRMSYRGKKVKRTPSQVMRDIIQVHMEELRQAGRSGSNIKKAIGNDEQHPDSCQSIGTAHSVKTKSSTNMILEKNYVNTNSYKPPHAQYYDACNLSEKIHGKSMSNMHYETDGKYKKYIHRDEESELKNASYSNHSKSRYTIENQKENGVEVIGCNSTSHNSRRSRGGKRDSYSSTYFDNPSKGSKALSGVTSHTSERNSRARLSESMTQNTSMDRYEPCSSFDSYNDVYHGRR